MVLEELAINLTFSYWESVSDINSALTWVPPPVKYIIKSYVFDF